MWYCRHEIQLRQAMFFSAASIAGAFSGLLAFAISKMHGVGGLEGWRWIFILEGIVTVVVAIAAYFLLYEFPETAGFLTEEERAFVIHRLKYQGQVAQTENSDSINVVQAEEFKWKYVRQAFLDWQIYVNIFVYWGVSLPYYTVYAILLIELGRLPSLWNQSVFAHHHQGSQLHPRSSPAPHCPNLHHHLHICRGRSLFPRSSR